ncbi:putative membrane protein [Oxalobacteraceae bacterium GrIS 2.11]
MTKLEFIAAFKLACDALPIELVDAALVNFERQFTDQLLAGVSEEVIVDRWGSPHTAALKLKLGTLNGNLKKTVSVEGVARAGISGIGLMVMDLFLLVPAAIYCAVLSAFYLAALLVYLAGIFISASSLAEVKYIDVPAHYFSNEFAMKGSTHLKIADIDIVPAELADGDDLAKAGSDDESPEQHPHHFLRDQGFHVATHLDKNTFWKGLATTLAGMLFLVLCFLATRFTFRMLRQFVAWHFSLLKNA